MPRKTHNINLVKITVSVHPAHVQRMEELLSSSDWGFSSQSDIVRQSLSQFFRKVEPEYTKLTPLQEEKVLKLSEKRQFQQMTDEEYATQVIKGLIFNNKDGIPYVVMHWYGNVVSAKPIKGCKEWFSTRLDIVDNHQSICMSKPIEEAIKEPSVISYLKSTLNIDVENQ